MRRPAVFFLVLAAWLLDAPPAPAQVMEPGEAYHAASGPQVEAILTSIERAVAADAASELADIADRIERDTELADIARERLLRELALSLAHVSPGPAAAALRSELERRPPGIRIWLREGRHQTDVPAFDVAAAARYTRRRWEEQAAAGRVHDAISVSDIDLAVAIASGDKTSQTGAIAALDELPDSTLIQMRDIVAEKLEATTDSTALAVTLAMRLHDSELAALAMRRGNPALVVHALSQMTAAFAPPAALDVLKAGVARDELTSAALFEIAKLAPAEPRALELLFNTLDDPVGGGSAAAALARLDDAAIALALEERLQSGKGGLAERRAALALRLSQTDAARDALSRAMTSPAVSAAIRRELSELNR
ncbi:hypothetical protein BH24PSE2_BH24PSE2_15390 [soil metagenome]